MCVPLLTRHMLATSARRDHQGRATSDEALAKALRRRTADPQDPDRGQRQPRLLHLAGDRHDGQRGPGDASPRASTRCRWSAQPRRTATRSAPCQLSDELNMELMARSQGRAGRAAGGVQRPVRRAPEQSHVARRSSSSVTLAAEGGQACPRLVDGPTAGPVAKPRRGALRSAQQPPFTDVLKDRLLFAAALRPRRC